MDVWLAITAGLLYLELLYWSPVWQQYVDIPANLTVRDWRLHGSSVLVGDYLPEVLLAVALLGLAAGRPAGVLARSLVRPTRRDWVIFGGLTLGISWILVSVGAWPWTWQWPPYDAFRIMYAVIGGQETVALLVWGIGGVVAIPILEEIVFRFGLLQLFERLTGSPRSGVIISSLAFGAAHLGGTFHPATAHLVNSVWLLVFGAVAGAVTVRRDHQIGPAIVMHMTRNGAEFATLLFAVHRA